MKKPDELVYLEIILERCLLLERYIRGKRMEDLYEDDLLQSGVLRELEVIGEAASHISDETKRKSPETTWRIIIAMRNILAHEYFEINLEIVWNTLKHDIPMLKMQIRKLRKKLD